MTVRSRDYRPRRRRDLWTIVVGVLIVLISNAAWAGVLWVWQNSEVNWQRYRDMLAAHAQYTNDPASLKAIVRSLQRTE